MCLSCNRASLPSDKMLTLNQASILFSKSSTCRVANDDDNNNLSGLGCGALALKMLSRTPRLLQQRSAGVPRRCLFGAPIAADTQRLLCEDLEAAKSRMARRWGWDVSKDKPSATSTWDWEAPKIRRHPYQHPAVSKRMEVVVALSPIPTPVSPLPDTPRAATKDFSPASTSSSSGTSSLSMSPSSPQSPSSSPTLKVPSSWDSEDSCCEDSDTDSCISSTPSCGSATGTQTVQTRLTDFWRSRRCSTSEIGGKGVPVVPTARTSTRTCSV